MPNISWNEIRHRALSFSRSWSEATREQADKQTFWNEFFDVFGIARRTVAAFEEPVHRLTGTTGFIDLFWPGKLLVEHKSAGHSLDAAESQAFAYIRDLLDAGRQDEIPRYVLLSDFRRFALYDLEPEDEENLPLFHGLYFHRLEFPLGELHRHLGAFAFIPGYKLHRFTEQDPANLKAVELMKNLHDALKEGGYKGHDLERFLVRILFCLFSDDTGIFEPSAFQLYIENRTQRDGTDLGARLAELFEILNTPEPDRQHNLDETLATFPYVNGQLFAEHLRFASFNAEMRNALLSCCNFDWSRISPAIFGALFQEVMTKKERRNIGAHYTSERDILKVIKPLFLDNLRAEFSAVQADRSTRRDARLDELRGRLSRLKFLDPACGCGNFLVISYRELRALELDILIEQHGTQQALTLDEVSRLSTIDVNQFYGIEIEEWPARIAEVALWLMDHQMNMRIHETFSQPFLRLPLRNSPHIHYGNALRMDWSDLLSPSECSFVLGNPPFVGKKARTAEQQSDLQIVFGSINGSGVLDYVCCWYLRAAQYIRGTKIAVGFVSTNSITQGEQPGILWPALFSHRHIKIHFAHRTFAWESEARGKAHVHVVIIGFGDFDIKVKRLYDYEGTDGNVMVSTPTNISPYLVEGNDRSLQARSNPVCKEVAEMRFGSMPNDDGNLVLSDEERNLLISESPEAGPLIRPLLSADEYLNGRNRWCLWLEGISPQTIRAIPEVYRRVNEVREYRAASKREATVKLAEQPSLFGENRQPTTKFVLVPRHSSETRKYIPMSYFTPRYIVSDSCLCLPDAKIYHFGILSSAMHMSWVKLVAGRLKSDFRYSNKLVYNNYPWPEKPTKAQQARVEDAAQAVIDARAEFSESSLAALYDPVLMPPTLVRAHQQLDRAVERCYRSESFANDRARVEFLFALYERITAPLLPAIPSRRRRVSRT
jgi:hypothetical protein